MCKRFAGLLLQDNPPPGITSGTYARISLENLLTALLAAIGTFAVCGPVFAQWMTNDSVALPLNARSENVDPAFSKIRPGSHLSPTQTEYELLVTEITDELNMSTVEDESWDSDAENDDVQLEVALDVESLHFSKTQRDSEIADEERKASAEFRYARRVELHERIHLITDVGAILEKMDGLEDVGDTVDTDSNRLDVNELSITWQHDGTAQTKADLKNSLNLSLGNRDVKDKHGWWFVDTPLGLGIKLNHNEWQLGVIGGIKSDQFSTQNAAFDSEEENIN